MNDKRNKDVTKAVFIDGDIAGLERSEMGNYMLEASNEVLSPEGVRLNFITLPIDVSAAMKIYESSGQSDLGNRMMAQLSGASKMFEEIKSYFVIVVTPQE
ncbi:MAG TPA: hypothetical protein PLQ57_06150 [Saprospiraceae bacterium]|nr:hypothetical protein [Saprospiraceae bacterium]